MDEITISKIDDDENIPFDDISDGDFEIETLKSVDTSKNQSKKPKLKPKPFIPKPKKQHVFKNFNDKSFEMFSNPQKKIQEEDSFNDQVNDQDDDFNDQNSNNDGDFENNDFEGDYGNVENEDVPSSGFQTIEDEKQDLLYKFHRLEQKGIKVKKFTIHSDIKEMRAEFNKIKKDAEMTTGVKFSKRLLMTFISGMEFLNKRYDPLGLELNGWSENVMENMNDGDYDNILERLHEKYSGKVNTPPEMELMMSLAGSAIMFHMTSSMFKNTGASINDFVKQNPNFMQDMMNKATKKQDKDDVNNEFNDEINQNDDDDNRRQMKGPSMDLSMFGIPQPFSTSVERNIDVDDDATSASLHSDDNTIKEVSLSSVSTSKKSSSSRRKKKLDASKGIDLNI